MPTKKHFTAVADIIAGDLACHRGDTDRTAYFAVRNVALSLSDLYARENPRFDRVTFLTACGFKPEDAPFTFGGAH